jgi:hypothetical protein
MIIRGQSLLYLQVLNRPLAMRRRTEERKEIELEGGKHNRTAL